jgi:GPCR proteolysis site, GPS, motif
MIYKNWSNIILLKSLLSDLLISALIQSFPGQPIVMNCTQITLYSIIVPVSNLSGYSISPVSGSQLYLQFPSTFSSLVSSLTSDLNVGILLAYMDSTPSAYNSTPTFFSVSIYSTSTLTELSINLNSQYININLPVYNLNYSTNPTCFFFDTQFFLWDKTGCYLLGTQKNVVNCRCVHLSLFSAGDLITTNSTSVSVVNQTIIPLYLPPKETSSPIALFICIFLMIGCIIASYFTCKRDKKDIGELMKLAYPSEETDRQSNYPDKEPEIIQQDKV